MTASQGQVLHVDFIALSDVTTAEQKDELLSAAGALREIEGVVEAMAIEGDTGSDYDLALLFVLRDFAALEPFGTDARYVRFLQRDVAPRLKMFAGADVSLEGAFPEPGERVACLILAAPAETYDWEIRQRLGDWASEQGATTVIGLAMGERQRFRGLAVAVGSEVWRTERPEVTGPEAMFVSGRARRLA